MHASVRSALQAWCLAHMQPDWHVADLGSYNVNGSVKDVLEGALVVGYDCVLGPGVDYVLADPPHVPEVHRGQYDLVVCTSVQTVTPDAEWPREEAWQLLKPDGWLFLTTCAPGCHCQHTTPWGEDRWRLSANDLILLMRRRFVVDRCEVLMEHPDVVYTGRRRA